MMNHPGKVITAAGAKQLAHMAAERVLDRLRRANERAAICITGGSSPQRLYQLLANEPYRSALPWERTHWFIGDERFVPQRDSLSNMGTARRTFLDALAPPANIHPIDTSFPNPDVAAQRYGAELMRFYGNEQLDPRRPLFDLVLMGLGKDGHTASLFPGAPTIEERTLCVIGVEQAKMPPFVPRVTLTFRALASTREMLFLVDDPTKRDVLARVFAGEDLPAARAHSDGELVWLLVRDAVPEDLDAA